MKVYISCHHPDPANELAAAIIAAGHAVVSTWHTSTDPRPAADGALSIDGAAEFAGDLSRDEIERAIGRGELETFRHGRRVLIAKRAVQRWLAGKLEQTRRERQTGAVT